MQREDNVSERLSDRVNVFRDEVLDSVQLDPRSGGGVEVFEAILRLLDARLETIPEIDMILRDALSRRLAWGDEASAILADADSVAKRLLDAAERSLHDPKEEIEVIRATVETSCIVSRFITYEELRRTAQARAILLREELAQSRLRQAINRQKEELDRLNKALQLKF